MYFKEKIKMFFEIYFYLINETKSLILKAELFSFFLYFSNKIYSYICAIRCLPFMLNYSGLMDYLLLYVQGVPTKN